MVQSSTLLSVRKVLGRMRRRFAVDRYDVFVRRVPEETDPTPPEGYVFRWGVAADIAACDEHHTELDARERGEGVQRLALDHRVVLGLQGELVVFSMWVNPRCLNLPGIGKRALDPQQWFIYKAFTSPEHRGRKLYECGMRFVLSEMQGAGLAELVGFAHVKKNISRRGLAAIAFEDVGRLTHVHWPGLEFTRLSSSLAARFPREVARSGSVQPIAVESRAS